MYVEPGGDCCPGRSGSCLLIAAATLVFQHIEKSRETAQKERENRLQVWKTILPDVVKAAQLYYMPVVRLLARLQDILAPSAAGLDEETARESVLLAAMCWKRVLELNDTVGGFYFRIQSGENLCANLADDFITIIYKRCGDRRRFLEAVLALRPATPSDVVGTLPQVEPGESLAIKFQKLVTQFQSTATQEDIQNIRILCSSIISVLDFEIANILYPEWYEDEISTSLALDSLDNLTTPGANSRRELLRQYLRVVQETRTRRFNITFLRFPPWRYPFPYDFSIYTMLPVIDPQQNHSLNLAAPDLDSSGELLSIWKPDQSKDMICSDPF